VRILADECLEHGVVERLRSQGHTVEAVNEQAAMRGTKDHPLLAHAVRANLLLLTVDRDFGDYIFRDRLPAPTAGVVLSRLPSPMLEAEKARIIGAVFATYDETFFAGRFTVIGENNLRSRPLPQ
jgi:predicted nuclease of predicted toxin-antitoxin system